MQRFGFRALSGFVILIVDLAGSYEPLSRWDEGKRNTESQSLNLSPNPEILIPKSLNSLKSQVPKLRDFLAEG